MPAHKKLVLIDGHSLAYRAYHALPPSMATTKGELTNAVYGFITTLLKILKDEQPDYLAVAFDVGRTFRDDMFREYKAQRLAMPDDLDYQFARIRALIHAFNIPILEVGGFEADDVLGTVARHAEAQAVETIIYTGDTDAFQLISPLTKVVVSRRQFGDMALYDEAAVKERYGLAPLQLADYRGVRARQAALRAEGRYLGIGLSTYVEVCGMGPSAAMPAAGWDSATIRVEPTGSVTVLTGISPHGQGEETTFAQLVADELGVPIDDIAVVHGDTDRVQYGVGTFGSRGTAVGGAALKLAIETIQAKALKIAAHQWEANADDLEYRDGKIQVKGDPSKTMSTPEAGFLAFACGRVDLVLQLELLFLAALLPPSVESVFEPHGHVVSLPGTPRSRQGSSRTDPAPGAQASSSAATTTPDEKSPLTAHTPPPTTPLASRRRSDSGTAEGRPSTGSVGCRSRSSGYLRLVLSRLAGR